MKCLNYKVFFYRRCACIFIYLLIFNLFSSFFSYCYTKNDNIYKALDFITNPKVRCFLNVISSAEGTRLKNKNSCPKLREYQFTFMNKSKLKNLFQYPKKLFFGNVRGKDVYGSASGRYQFIRKTWEYLEKKYSQERIVNQNNQYFYDFYKNKMHELYSNDIINYYSSYNSFIKNKFGPFWQDFYAILLLIEKNAVEDLLKNDIDALIKKTAKIWASFPKMNNNKSFYNDFINNNNAQSLSFIKNSIQECIFYDDKEDQK